MFLWWFVIAVQVSLGRDEDPKRKPECLSCIQFFRSCTFTVCSWAKPLCHGDSQLRNTVRSFVAKLGFYTDGGRTRQVGRRSTVTLNTLDMDHTKKYRPTFPARSTRSQLPLHRGRSPTGLRLAHHFRCLPVSHSRLRSSVSGLLLVPSSWSVLFSVLAVCACLLPQRPWLQLHISSISALIRYQRG